MILIDVNILVYATAEDSPHHQALREWLDDQLNSSTRVALPWPSLLGFLRVITNRRAFPRALPMDAAWRQVEAWLTCETTWVPQPTEHHARILGSLLTQPGIRSNLVPDMHLAALAIEHGLTLCSTDGDFARFRELKWMNPLAA